MNFLPGDIIVRDDCAYPAGALVVVGRGENNELLAYPEGGGPQLQIPPSEVRRFSSPTQAERTPIYKCGVFTIEGIEEKFPGWWDGKSWNGWAMPKFEYAEANRIIAALCPSGSRLDDSADTFVTAMSEGEEETWPAETIALPDGGILKVYAIGAGSWIWDKAEEEVTPCL